MVAVTFDAVLRKDFPNIVRFFVNDPKVKDIFSQTKYVKGVAASTMFDSGSGVASAAMVDGSSGTLDGDHCTFGRRHEPERTSVFGRPRTE